MANAIQWQAALTDRGNVLTTEMNSLTNTSRTAAGTAVDNSTNLDKYGWLECNFTFGTNPTSTAYMIIYMVMSADGTNYADGDASNTPGFDAVVATFSVRATTSAQRKIIGPIMLPPTKVKFLVENQAGQTMAASGNTVKLWTDNDEIQ